MKKKNTLISLALLVCASAGHSGTDRQAYLAQIDAQNLGSGVMVCGVGGMPIYTGEYNEQNVNGYKFLLPYMKSSVGKHNSHDNTMGSGALSAYLAYYSNSDGKNMSMYTLDGWVLDTSYNSSTSKDYKYSPVSLDYYFYDVDKSMANIINTGIGAAYKINTNPYSHDDVDSQMNPFSKDVISGSSNLNYVNYSDLEPTKGWYGSDKSSWGNMWFTHQYVYKQGMFSHSFIYMNNHTKADSNDFDNASGMAVACLVYDNYADAQARKPYGEGLIGSFRLRYNIYANNEDAMVEVTYNGDIGVNCSNLKAVKKSDQKNVNGIASKPSSGFGDYYDDDQKIMIDRKLCSVSY